MQTSNSKMDQSTHAPGVTDIDAFPQSSSPSQLNVIDESSDFQCELQMNFMRTLSNVETGHREIHRKLGKGITRFFNIGRTSECREPLQ